MNQFNQNSYMSPQYQNSYLSYQQPYMGYLSQPQQMQNRQQFQMSPVNQNQSQNEPINRPFTDVRIGTLDEAKAHIVGVNNAIMFIDKQNSQFYIKRADSMGNPYLEVYKYSLVNDNAPEQKTSDIDPNLFVKKEEIKNFITKDDIKNFITREDLSNIDSKIEEIHKKINLNNIIKEGI